MPIIGTLHFYPRSPCGERRPRQIVIVVIDDFYPRSPCGERRYSLRRSAQDWHFYPRSPCGERPRAEHHASTQQEFLSTLSLRRATINSSRAASFQQHFYPRSPCGERRVCQGDKFRQGHFYPRSPCGERRFVGVAQGAIAGFLSTLSLRRATDSAASRPKNNQISIHALLAESDSQRR